MNSRFVPRAGGSPEAREPAQLSGAAMVTPSFALDFERSISDAVARRAEHDVRGHWRKLRNEDGSIRRRVWVSEHKRGTAPPVQRSYAVADARNAAPPPGPAGNAPENGKPGGGRSTWKDIGRWIGGLFGRGPGAVR